ncbi:hypothetical protein C8T65DRAFT_626672 [Cerioporus squamosus]|nr:hypothetical protein C8T65DRAFT_626672 [Cerioporus squamosus]
MARRLESSRPNERTPLLAGSSRSASARNVSSNSRSPVDASLPHVGLFVAGMRPEDLHKYSVDNLYPHTLQSRPAQTSFALCALLYYRRYLREASALRRDIWAQWRQQEVEALTDQVWAWFLEEEGLSEDVQEVLWMTYPLYPDSRQTVRVFDFLQDAEAPQSLLSHRLIQLCVDHTWIYGRDGSPVDADLWTRMLHFWDSTGVPHVLHLFDFLVYLVYLGVLCSYLLDPPVDAQVFALYPRSGWIALYALLRICRSWSLITPPFLLTLLALILTFPSTPLPDSIAYTLLLVAFSWKIVLLHLHVHPSPLFLLYPERTLPLAVLVWRGLAQTFIPVVAFFIPGLLVSLFLLSTSLSDKFLWFRTAFSASASPMESRVIFLSLFTIFFLFLICALGYAVLIHPFLASSEGPCEVPWDRFSTSVGLEARQLYARTVDTYTTPYYFPAPFNILQVLFVQLPQTVLSASLWDTPKHTRRVEKVLWRIIIAPVTFVLSAFWLWNLPGRW